MRSIDPNDVQGLLFGGYKTMAYADYYMLKIEDASKARQWLSALESENRIAHCVPNESENWRLNIAFTYTGLEALGLDKNSLNSFEQSFRMGMHSDRRARILGDAGEDAPLKWEWGNESKEVHVLLMLFTGGKTQRQERTQIEELSYTEGGLSDVYHVESKPLPKKDDSPFAREHFGFADGVSQPKVEGFPFSSSRAAETKVPKVQTGEFLLGYPNEYDRITKIPFSGLDGNGPGVNGTYLVCRQLQQHVSKFWSFNEKAAGKLGESPEYWASKMVGRWPSGCLVEEGQKTDPQTKPSNDFDYTDDPDGFGSPMGSHVRRSNPRGVGLSETSKRSIEISNLHRLLRRGRSYGPPAEKGTQEDKEVARGLLFICLNANIERQFEFVQHTWTNNIKFAGLYEEDDPLIANTGGGERKFSIPGHPMRSRLSEFKQFITMKGGAYFFLPSISAIRFFASSGAK